MSTMVESLISVFHSECFWFISNPLEIIDPPTLVESEATPQEKWALDWEAWEALYQEPWYLNQEEEPINYLGKSVLVRWLAQPKTEGEKEWSCCVPLKGETWCGHKIKRLDRAITHVRGHLNLRPYPCGGRCENENWYAAQPLRHKWWSNTVTSTTRFGSNEYRSAHYQGPDNRECPWW